MADLSLLRGWDTCKFVHKALRVNHSVLNFRDGIMMLYVYTVELIFSAR